MILTRHANNIGSSAANSATSKRVLTTGRAFPLGDPGAPGRAAGAAAIVRFLDVEKSARYKPADGKTYCNIYAYDFCFLSGVYLPRVWWLKDAIKSLNEGNAVAVKYAVTVGELNANALYDWLSEFGASFGWKKVATLDDLQKAANAGSVAVICAARKDPKRSGHITVVVPEDVPPLLAQRSEGAVSLPLQSQAGVRNFCFSCGTGKWWEGLQFRASGFWMHD